MSLPNWLFVQEKRDGNGEPWLEASREQGETVEDDGTVQIVGSYKLIKKVKIRKRIELVLPARKVRKRGR